MKDAYTKEDWDNMDKVKTTYEWCIETRDEWGDMIENSFYDELSEIKKPFDGELVLVRDKRIEAGDLEDRQWAYLEDGKLPDEFDQGGKIPKRFIKELQAF